MRGIFHTIEQYHMIEPGMRVIAGVSGGADSVCLLYALLEYRKKLPFEISVVHVEHGLRGADSLADAAFVETLCQRLGAPCRIVSVDVRQLARERNLSLEEAGRGARYRIFEEIQREQNAQRIAVAHNQNDQAETVLWNLARGSGLKGLGGIRPVRGDIIRPLLFTGREHIEALLEEAGLSWRTDQTNLQQDYTRNKVRLSLLPQMQQELNSRAPEHIAQAAGKLQQVQAFVERMTEQAAGMCISCQEDVSLYLPAFKEQDLLIRQELLRRAMELSGGLKDVGSVHLEALMELAEMDCGKAIDLPGQVRAVREARIIRFIRRRESGRPGKHPQGADGRAAAQDAGAREIALPIPGECYIPGSGREAGDSRIPEMCRGLEEYRIPETCRELGDSRIPGTCRGPEEGWIPETCREPGEGCTPDVGELAGRRIRVELLENSPEIMREIPEEKKYTKWLSYDTIKGDILLRHRRTGDYLVVNAQGGRKKLKDYFIDLKIPRDMRDQLWLLADGAHVLWVPGYRISETAKVHEGTRKVIKIQMEDEIK